MNFFSEFWTALVALFQSLFAQIQEIIQQIIAVFH